MKKYSLICLLLCAVLLLAPRSICVYAEDLDTSVPGSKADNPIILTSMPFEAALELEENADGIYPSTFYQYTSTRACRLVVEVIGDAVAIIMRNGEQIIGTVDMMEGDVIDIELFPITAGAITMKLSEADFPLGSRYNPIELDFNDLKAGFTFDLTQQESIWYKTVAPETGVLNFISSDMPWGYRLGFNGNTTTDEATVIHHYMQTGSRPVSAGEEFLLCAEYGAAEPGKFTVKVEYVPPFTIDAATQAIMFNGLYDVKTSDGIRIYGVEFNFEAKNVSVMDMEENKFLGTYNFFYNLENGALELTNNRGEKAPYIISVVEDPTKDLGAYLKLSYNGHYTLNQLTQEEINALEPNEAALDLLNGKYEDIFLGEVYETFIFTYNVDDEDERYVIVAPDWESEGVVYYIESYSVFTGALVLKSEDGDVITMNAIAGQIIYNENVLTPLHEHKYKEDVTYPTCTEGGYTIFTCDCGETYRGDETNPLGHNWAPATCEAPATCQNCGLTEGEALGHDWLDATCTAPKTCANCGLTEGETLPHNWQDATCTAPKTCADCGVTEGEMLPHNWQDATCTTPKTCADCGVTEGETLPHNWQDATCTTPKTCADCGQTEGEVLSHEWIPATCTTPKTCAACGATEGTAPGHNWENATCETPKTCYICGTTEGSALGHKWNEATCTAPKTCATCGETEGSALGHKWAAATCTAPRTCATCGMTEGSALGHEWIPATCETAKTCAACGMTEGTALGHEWIPATCETAKTCSVCGKVEGAALGHSWVNATCETAKTCSVCGETEGEALGHDWNEGVVTVEPTEESEGEKIVTCQRCGLEEKRVVPSLSHVHKYTSVVTAPTCEAAGYTTFSCACGDSYVEEGAAALGHAYQSVITEATCTAGGYTTHTCDRCGDTYTDARVDALGHAYQSVVTEPTCTTDGYTTHTCDRCGDVKVDTRVGATGHDYVSVVTRPTCTEGGYTTHTCSACGDEYVDAQTNAKGHSYKHEVTAPTCDKEGYTTHTCTACGNAYVDTKTDALGHNYKHEVTAPTCTEGGHTTHTCDRCGHEYVDSQNTALGHNYQHEVTAPTCTKGGYTTHTCDRCGHSYQDTKVNALGHDWVDATCTAPKTCATCGKTQGKPAAHKYNSGVQANGKITYTCTVCGHTYQEDASSVTFTVPGTLTGTVYGSQDYSWTATEEGFLQIDNVANLTGAYITVSINGEIAQSTADGYAVQIGDKVIITVTTYSEIEINIPVAISNGNSGSQGGESPMEFDVSWAAGSWGGYEGNWTAPYAGTFSFIIDASNIAYENLYFAVVTADGWGTWYVLNEDFFLNADGKYAVTLSVTEGENLKIMAYEDTHTNGGQLHIVVVEGEVAEHEHAFDEGVVTEPTCTADGKTTYTCTLCGETKVEKISKLGHTEETIPGKAATCTETGLTEGIKCTVCGEIITAQNEIAVLAHSYGAWETVKEPTATEDGSKKRACSACGAEETEVIPATGEVEPQPTDPKPTDPKPTEPTTKPTEPEIQPTTKPATRPNGTQPGDIGGGNNGVIIAVIVVVVLLAGGAVAFIMIKKKK